MSHPSRSDEQQQVESMILELLAAETGLRYESEKVPCGAHSVEIDGVGRNESGEIVELVEIYARQGKLKGSQPRSQPTTRHG